MHQSTTVVYRPLFTTFFLHLSVFFSGFLSHHQPTKLPGWLKNTQRLPFPSVFKADGYPGEDGPGEKETRRFDAKKRPRSLNPYRIPVWYIYLHLVSFCGRLTVYPWRLTFWSPKSRRLMVNRTVSIWVAILGKQKTVDFQGWNPKKGTWELAIPLCFRKKSVWVELAGHFLRL